MDQSQLNNLLDEIKKLKATLLNNLEQEINFLKENNVELDIDLNDLWREMDAADFDIEEYTRLQNELADLEFIDKLKPLINEVPVSNGSKYFGKFNINIGIIADEFLFNSFKDIANFYYVERDNYTHLKNKIDVLLIATAWRGLKGDWKGLGNPNITKIRKSIFEVIDYFKSKGVKVVFYSKEDPTNYDYFVDIAEKCDYIFTTCAEKVEDYKKDCKNENVYVLEFGFNPIYNNPIGTKPTQPFEGALFAGSWYERYPERKKDTRLIFDGIIDSDVELKIIDRNFGLKLKYHLYPLEYLSYVTPSVEHEDLQSLIKLYRWIINLNTVKYSQTMFANRVYEIQAMGSLLLSNYSLGINNYFPNVNLIFDKNEVKYIVNNLTEYELYRHRMYGVRQVFRSHTTYHRISDMLNKIGINNNFTDDKNLVVVVKEKNDHVINMFNRQSYPNKTLLTLEEAYNTTSNFDFLAFFDSTSDYGEYYLEDMVNAFKYVDVSFVTKDSYYNNSEKIEGVENDYVDQMKSKYRTVFSLEDYSIQELINDDKNLDFSNGYSIDSLEYNQNKELVYVTSKNKKFSVIIPTYNNGLHLYGKCFMSLRRSSMFEEMEIIIVDDGSTDKETLTTIERLQRQYDNIIVYKFEPGGSGSASRPRNKGIELSTTDYITFLDPDNEAVNDGYAKLYHEISNNDYDLVIGNIKKVDTAEKDFNYYRDVYYYEGKNEFTNHDPREYLDNTHFKAQSIQALMVKKDVITMNNIKMIPGAVGEDTLFFHELIINSKQFKVINEIIHIYYAGVEGSSVNYITKNTFQKYYTLEKERIKFLKRNNLLNTYFEKRFNYYFENWYFKKLDIVKSSDYNDAVEILLNIYKLYEVEVDKKSKIDKDIRMQIKKLRKEMKI